MEWLWFDPDRDEPTRWWTIDPQTGQPDGRTATDPAHHRRLGVSALDDVSFVADAIATKFTTKGFADEEEAALLTERVVPVAFRGRPVENDFIADLGTVAGLDEAAARRRDARSGVRA